MLREPKWPERVVIGRIPRSEPSPVGSGMEGDF